MLVIADTSPLIGLIKIGLVEILPRLYGDVVIPAEVAAELLNVKRQDIIREFIESPPAWLSIQTPYHLEIIEGLDSGEIAAISLATQLNADLLLIDEIRGREAAMMRRIPTARTAAVIFDAANAGIVTNLRAAFDDLRTTNFRVPGKVLDELLKRHEEMRGR